VLYRGYIWLPQCEPKLLFKEVEILDRIYVSH